MADLQDVAELVRRSQRGDAGAFAEIIRRRGRLVLGHLRGKGLPLADAEDVAQETFLRAWRGIGQLRDPRQLNAWLLTLASNAAASAARRAGARKRGGIMGRLDERGVAAPRDDADGPTEQAEERARMLAALGELPERYRTALELRYLAGCDGAAIREQMNLSDGALRGLLHRGLALLRAALDERETDHAERA